MMVALDPKTAQEVVERLRDYEDLAFLPSQLKFEQRMIWFPHNIGWMPTEPGPATIPVYDISVRFLMKIPAGYTLQVRFKSGWKPGMKWPTSQGTVAAGGDG